LSGYYCRPIKLVGGGYGSTWSNHAWGLAVDFNAPQFPFGTKTTNSTLITIGNIAEQSLVCGNGARIFRWGQYFGSPDPMHFQVCCSPGDLATGVFAT